jgi:hypothetical protein
MTGHQLHWSVVKTGLSLSLIKHHIMKTFLCSVNHCAMMTYRVVEVQLHTFLTLALGAGEWSVSCPAALAQ